MQQKNRAAALIPALCAVLVGALVVVRSTSPELMRDWAFGLACGMLIGVAFVSLVKSKRRPSAG